tara:strand:- start:5660 stop:6673 length:1014 start_codon:yes stop_codon:yes gene_type:complete
MLQRKAAIIRYYLRKNQQFPSNVKANIAILGMTRAGLEKWIKGETHQPRAIDRLDAALKQAIGLETLTPNLLSRETGVMEFGNRLGLSRAECQIAIDEVAGELGPTFSSFSMSPEQASGLLQVFQGLYVIYRLERTAQAQKATGDTLSIMCMTMSVRHKLRGSKPLSSTLQRIRCKLHIPSYRVNIPYFEYDGYLAQTDPAGKHYWLYEARHEIERDMVFMMTDVLQSGTFDGQRRLYCYGTMITRSQDQPGLPMIWPVLIERRADLVAPAKQKDESFERSAEKIFTEEYAALKPPSEVEPWVLQALQEAESFASHVRFQPHEVGESWSASKVSAPL